MGKVADFMTGLLGVEPWGHRELSNGNGPIETQIAKIRRPYPLTPASVEGALGVPAILRCVTLIANTTGVLSMAAYRDGTRVPAMDRPRLIIRPNPRTRPRVFWRDTAYWLATRGEVWWWIARRDADDQPMSIVPVSPVEVTVEDNPANSLSPIVKWRTVEQDERNFVQLTYLPGANGRGVGPLQLAGVAAQVGVEAQAWAARFFAKGGYPREVLRFDGELTEKETDKAREKWVSVPSNEPRVLTEGWDVDTPRTDVPAAQMLEARRHEAGEAARMFGIPGSLVDYIAGGSTITYQNVGSEFDKFVRACLWPNYLEEIEQAMTDLVPRNLATRFDLKALLRADPKTRYETHKIGIDAGFLRVPEARVEEELDPGSIEVAPIPASPPAATPPPVRLAEFRCPTCRRLLAEQAGEGTRIKCRCGTLAAA